MNVKPTEAWLMWMKPALSRILTVWLLSTLVYAIVVHTVGITSSLTDASLFISFIMVLVAKWFLRRDRIQIAAILVCTTLWIVVTLSIFLDGGLRVPGWTIYLPVVIMVGLFIGARTAVAVAIVTLLMFVLSTWGMMSGWIKPLGYTPDDYQYLTMAAVPLFSVAALVFMIGRAIESATTIAQARTNELSLSEQRFRQLVEYSADSVLITDPDTCQILDANNEACRSLGYDHAELMTLYLSDIHPAPLPEKKLSFHPTFTVTEHRRKDGTSFPVEVRSNLFNIDGQTKVIATIRDLSEREKSRLQLESAYHNLQALVAEKDALLREVHHRVDNNLQVILSMLHLREGDLSAAEQEANRVLQSRVRAMSLVHRQLYRAPNVAQVDFSAYLRRLVAGIGRTYIKPDQQIEFTYHVEAIMLTINTAITAGLIVNEIVTNALQHAFPNNQPGIITLHMSADNQMIYLEISDDGCGFAVSQQSLSDTLGLTLIHQLAQQLRATLHINSDQTGSTFQLNFAKIAKSTTSHEQSNP